MHGDEIKSYAHIVGTGRHYATKQGDWLEAHQGNIMPALLKLADFGPDEQSTKVLFNLYDQLEKEGVSRGYYAYRPFACRVWVLDILVIINQHFKVIDLPELYMSQWLSMVPWCRRFEDRLMWQDNVFAEVTKKDLQLPGYSEMVIRQQMDELKKAYASERQSIIQGFEEPYRQLDFTTWTQLLNGWEAIPETLMVEMVDQDPLPNPVQFLQVKQLDKMYKTTDINTIMHKALK